MKIKCSSPSYRLSRQAINLVHSVLDEAQKALDNASLSKEERKERNEARAKGRESMEHEDAIFLLRKAKSSSPSYRLRRQAINLVYSVLDEAQKVVDNASLSKEERKERGKRNQLTKEAAATNGTKGWEAQVSDALLNQESEIETQKEELTKELTQEETVITTTRDAAGAETRITTNTGLDWRSKTLLLLHMIHKAGEKKQL